MGVNTRVQLAQTKEATFNATNPLVAHGLEIAKAKPPCHHLHYHHHLFS